MQRLFHTVQERSATNCLNNKVLRALRNESREVMEVRLGGRYIYINIYIYIHIYIYAV